SPETSADVDPAKAQAYYRFDAPDVARFKYLVAVGISNELRSLILDRLFATFLGDEGAFARQLYLSWAETRALQEHGMVVGGHSHLHAVLRGVDEARQREDLATCTAALRARLRPQPHWPFSYPYGEYDDTTIALLKELQFECSFATWVGTNPARSD